MILGVFRKNYIKENTPMALSESALSELFDAFEAKQPSEIDETALLGDLRSLVQPARQRLAVAAFSTQASLCWHIGRRLDGVNL